MSVLDFISFDYLFQFLCRIEVFTIADFHILGQDQFKANSLLASVYTSSNPTQSLWLFFSLLTSTQKCSVCCLAFHIIVTLGFKSQLDTYLHTYIYPYIHTYETYTNKLSFNLHKCIHTYVSVCIVCVCACVYL